MAGGGVDLYNNNRKNVGMWWWWSRLGMGWMR